MDEADRSRRLEEGKKLLKEKREKKKSKGKKKKTVNPGQVSIDVETSVLEDSAVSLPVSFAAGNAEEEVQEKSRWDENGSLQDGMLPNSGLGTLSNSVPVGHYGVESELLNLNDEVKSLDPPKDPAMAFLDNWDHLNSQTHHSEDPLPTHDGTTENHFSSTPPDLSSAPSASSQGGHSEREEQRDFQVAQLKNDIITLQNEREQILNELNSLRENQFDTVERARREVSTNYDLKLANLQQALVEKEHHMQNMEQQLIDTKRSHGEEVERYQQELSQRDQKYANALSEHEKMHAEMLSERERRHAEQLARLSSGESNHRDPLAVQLDSDELEAERLKLIKEKLREIHEAEKKRIISEHEEEKQRIQSDFQRKIDDYCKQAVSDANTKIKDMYEQFVTAHKAVEDQKRALEGTVSDLSSEISTLRSLAEKSQLEKASIEEEYERLRESHTAEIELERRNFVTLEMKLKDWKEKASRLETDLVKSEHQEEPQTDRDEAITRMSLEYEERIQSLQLQVEESQGKLQEFEARHQLELSESQTRYQQECLLKLQAAEEQNQKQVEEIVAKYKEQLSEVKSDHASQVDLLEASVSEFTCSKGSLEVAEEHMKSLQEQLNLYRNQEKSFEARITDLNRQHAEDLSVLKMQLETERLAEVESVREQCAGQIEVLEKQHSGQIGDFEHLIEVLRGHSSNLPENSNSRYSNEVALLQSIQQRLRESEEREAELQQDLREMDARKEADAKCLQSDHEAQVAILKQQLSSVRKDIDTSSEERLKSLKTELADLSYEKSTWEAGQKDLMSQLELSHRQRQDLEHTIKRLEGERKHLSEECDRFQKAAKNFEVDVSISKSAEEQSKLKLEKSNVALQESLAALNAKDEDLTSLRAEFEKLESENEHLQEEGQAHESEIERLREEGQTHEAEYQQLLDLMGAKNKSVADLQAENDSLATSVEVLKKKQEEYADMCEKLKSQLESSWGVNEELGALKEQVAGLLTYKENYGNMQQRVEFLEAMVRSKDESIATLQEDMEKSSKTRSHVEESLANASSEVEALKREMTRLLQIESTVKAQLTPMETDLVDGSELNSLIEGMHAKIEEAESRCEMNVAEIDGMKSTIEELNTQLSLSRSRLSEYAEKVARNDQEIENLKTQLSLSKSTIDEYAERITKNDKEIEGLSTQLSSSKSKNDEYMEKIAKSDREIEELNSRLSATLTAKESGTSEMDKMNRIITDLRTRMASVDDELAQKSQVLHDQNQTIEDLEAKLTQADADVTELQAERSRLELDLLQSQADPDSSNADSELQDLAQKYGDLQQAFEDVKRERAELLAEVNDLRISSTTTSSSKSLEALEVKVEEQEKTIAELRDKLSRSGNSNSFTRPFQSDLNYSRSPLEATLTRARQTLIEKLQEKAAIEKELGMRRATLECQKTEKQHLEDLLYEKKRFEQELQNQKTLLQTELANLEGRLGSGRKAASQSLTTTKVN